MLLPPNDPLRPTTEVPPMPTDEALQQPITLRAKDGAYIPVRRASFALRVDGPRVTTEATLHFHNETGRVVEADLVFPLPPFASVRGLRARWGQHALDGAVRPRDEARRTYDEALAHGHAAVIGEGEGEDLTRLRIAPIEPDADVEVTLEIVHGAVPTMEGHRVIVPLTYMPRYVEGAASLTETEAAALARPRPATLDARAEVSLTARDLTPDRVRCTTHATATRAVDGGVELRVDGAPLDRDLIVELLDRPTGERPTVALRTAFGEGPDGYGPATLATLTPPAFADEGPTTPRTVLFLVDRSGSMGGGPMESAKRAVRGSLRALGPEDRFNIIAFDDALDALAATTVPFTDASLSAADRFASGLDARGGTEASQALRAVLTDAPKGLRAAWKEKFPQDPRARLRLVVFMTDGDVAGAAEVLRAAKSALRDTRVHVLGIGDSVNHALLGELAALGGGTYTPVGTDEDLERAIAHLKSAMNAPVWTSVEGVIERKGTQIPLAELEPPGPWDLFAGAPLTVAWRGRAQAGDVLRFTGRGPDGAPRELSVALDEVEAAEDVLPRWASLRARRLTYRFNPEDDAALETLGTGYSLLTRKTALVAVDPNAAGAVIEASLPVSLPLPRNVHDGEQVRRGLAGFTGSFGAAAPMAAMGAMPPPAAAMKKRAKGASSFLAKAAQKVQDLLGGAAHDDGDDAYAAAEMADAEMDFEDSLAPSAPAPSVRRAMPAGAPMPSPQGAGAREESPVDEGAALRGLLLDQRADGLFGDVANTLAAVAALVSRGHTPREGGYRAELKRTLATLRARLPSLSGDEAVWARVAVALLTAPHGAEPEGLAPALDVAARALATNEPNTLRARVIALLDLAPAGWDAAPRAAATRRALLR